MKGGNLIATYLMLFLTLVRSEDYVSSDCLQQGEVCMENYRMVQMVCCGDSACKWDLATGVGTCFEFKPNRTNSGIVCKDSAALSVPKHAMSFNSKLNPPDQTVLPTQREHSYHQLPQSNTELPHLNPLNLESIQDILNAHYSTKKPQIFLPSNNIQQNRLGSSNDNPYGQDQRNKDSFFPLLNPSFINHEDNPFISYLGPFKDDRRHKFQKVKDLNTQPSGLNQEEEFSSQEPITFQSQENQYPNNQELTGSNNDYNQDDNESNRRHPPTKKNETFFFLKHTSYFKSLFPSIKFLPQQQQQKQKYDY